MRSLSRRARGYSSGYKYKGTENAPVNRNYDTAQVCVQQ